MDKQTADHAAEVLKAVAHPVRLRIVDLLKQGELCVGDIVAALGTKHSLTSQQLNMMKIKGVLQCRREGPKVYYRIGNPNIIKLLRCITEGCQRYHRPAWPPAVDQTAGGF
ncbi:MAG: helix-turn-helix transcriptional regulator [Sedimentisphaerales bacterium]|nr:helix-turn-helix transcriptional regulator [Sedimentisphaerales bacterium]